MDSATSRHGLGSGSAGTVDMEQSPFGTPTHRLKNRCCHISEILTEIFTKEPGRSREPSRHRSISYLAQLPSLADFEILKIGRHAMTEKVCQRRFSQLTFLSLAATNVTGGK